MTIHSQTRQPPQYAQLIASGAHQVIADVPPALGGDDSGPSPHDLFDASLVACKTLTAHYYAKRRSFPLERVEAFVDRDDSREREGKYTLKLRLEYHGPLTPEQLQQLHDAVGRCPVHKLMTSVEVSIETAPLAPPA